MYCRECEEIMDLLESEDYGNYRVFGCDCCGTHCTIEEGYNERWSDHEGNEI